MTQFWLRLRSLLPLLAVLAAISLIVPVTLAYDGDQIGDHPADSREPTGRFWVESVGGWHILSNTKEVTMPQRRFAPNAHSVIAASSVNGLLANRNAVILERLARGGGATRWYFCTNEDALRDISARLSPGSLVSFYFDGRIKHEPYSAVARATIERIICEEREAVVGYLQEAGPRIEVQIVAGPAELDELAPNLIASSSVFYGAFPARDNDGVRAVTIVLPDEDGIVRRHPY